MSDWIAGAGVRTMQPFRMLLFATAALVVLASSAAGQINEWSLGLTWAGMSTKFDGETRAWSNGLRKMVTFGVGTSLAERGPGVVRSEVRLTTKGRSFTGPSYFIEYLELPLSAWLISPGRFGPFVAGALVPGIRIFCFAGKSRFDRSCSDRGIARTELSWEASVGLRFQPRAGGAINLVLSRTQSLSDIEPHEFGQEVHTVHAVRFLFEVAR